MNWKKNMYSALVIIFLFALCCPAFADVTISGTQTRGHGTNGKIHSNGVSLQNGGEIVKVNDSGAGFWIQSDKGHIFRFDNAKDAIGKILESGVWYAYPNLYQNRDHASVSVIVRTGGAAPAPGPGPAVPLPNQGPGAPFSANAIIGTWNINANNYPGQLEFMDAGGKIQGRMYFEIAKKWEHLTDISYNAGRIQFTRPWSGNPKFQQYSGQVSGSSINGTFTDTNHSGKSFPWSGTKIK